MNLPATGTRQPAGDDRSLVEREDRCGRGLTHTSPCQPMAGCCRCPVSPEHAPPPRAPPSSRPAPSCSRCEKLAAARGSEYRVAPQDKAWRRATIVGIADAIAREASESARQLLLLTTGRVLRVLKRILAHWLLAPARGIPGCDSGLAQRCDSLFSTERDCLSTFVDLCRDLEAE